MTAALLDELAGLRVVVVGDSMLDVYLDGEAVRLCREAPAPVVRIDDRTASPGGAGNTAMNLTALGGRTCLVSVVGDDADGAELRRRLADGGVCADHVVVAAGRPTLATHRVLASSQLLVRFDAGAETVIDEETDAAVAECLREVVPGADAVILSDYGHGVLTATVVETLGQLTAEAGPVLVVDSKHPAAFRRLRPTAVKPNWDEAVELLGAGELDGFTERADGIAPEGDRLLEATGAGIVAVTLDAEGAIVFERGRPPHRTHAPPSEGTLAAGAGDTFVSAFTLALAAGAHTPAAAELASAAAAVVVTKDGRTVTCSAAELRRRVTAGGKVLDGADRLVEVVEVHRRAGRRIVFTNGCFDILHRGHITYLNRAKNLGDVLVVGLNDDDSVRRLKGEGRPVTRLEDRAEVLAALSCVDHIVAFSGDSPRGLIERVRPDVYAKGGDYTAERLPEAPLVESLGGEVRILPLMEDRSTTGIIRRIRRAGAG